MALYLDLRKLFNDADLVNRTAMATLISVNTILEASPTAKDKAYAALVSANPSAEAKKVLMFVLAANNGLAVATIQSANDAALQTKVDAIVLILIDALAGI